MGRSKQGAWVTKHMLAAERHWTKPMIEAAWDWAKARNLWRVNPIHKEEEIKVVLEDAFKYAEESGFETRQEATMEMEDPDGSLLDGGDLIPGHLSKLLPEVDDSKLAGEDAMPGTGASFRLVFPTMQENSSPLSVITTFLETLGRKIDNADLEKEKIKAKKSEKGTQLLVSLDSLLKLMNDGYDDLSKLQGSWLSESDEPGVQGCTRFASEDDFHGTYFEFWHSMCTRLLASMMPADMYADNDKTLDSMAQFTSTDLEKCFFEGVNNQVFFMIWVGVKGDWPWLRKAMSLVSGPTSGPLVHDLVKPTSSSEHGA
ncbi:Uncharacterized protein SCF082_LOCUS5791 [Durusdinium trenchii]|uniref:Uncharacterized protein n=1 Tax=Durusdinium trenchii TaxID=1381693 RepID=A0ABP0I8A3_9DINO